MATADTLGTTELFAALNNETRQRMLMLMAENGEVCVCEFVDALQISQPTASKALAQLRSAGLLADRRDANWTYYTIRTDLPDWVAAILNATVQQLAGHRVCREDQLRFTASTSRDIACT